MGFKVGDLVTTKEYIIGGNLYRITKYDAMTRKYSLEFVGPEIYRGSIDCDIDDGQHIFSEDELILYVCYKEYIKGEKYPFYPNYNDYINKFYKEKGTKRDDVIASLASYVNHKLEEKSFVCENKKEEDKMLSIVENYKERQEDFIKKRNNETIEKIKKEDKMQQIFDVAISQINIILKEEDRPTINLNFSEYTKNTEEKIAGLNKLLKEELDKLYANIDDINSLLELAETYEQKMDILKAYDIIDKKGKVI